MLKLIKAEFENFDYAEMASIKLRKNIKGIRKIKIMIQYLKLKIRYSVINKKTQI